MMAMKAAKMSQTIKKIQKVRISTLEWKDSNLKTDEVRTTKKAAKTRELSNLSQTIRF